MKKILLFIVSVFIVFISFSQTDLKRQAFWGASFIPNPGSKAGVTVQRAVAGSPAQLAGLQNGDVIVRANGILLSDPYVYGKTFRSFRGGDKVVLSVLRNDKLIDLFITPTRRPLEQYKDIEVQYGSIITDKGHHVRTILTKPAGARGKLPVIFVTQWLSCSQVEVNVNNMSDTDSLFNDLITRSGYAFMRVEKPGLGDSEGPDCS
ncbi:MAG TPA: PDZ domain-containing protein, partial [Chitinophagaceae bacterium]|nr:PDZ domain-containing protein [Chitinophagaceae bacterium]